MQQISAAIVLEQAGHATKHRMFERSQESPCRLFSVWVAYNDAVLPIQSLASTLLCFHGQLGPVLQLGTLAKEPISLRHISRESLTIDA